MHTFELDFVCPFCGTKILAMDAESAETVKTFMGKHLAHNHQKQMDRVLKKIEKQQECFHRARRKLWNIRLHKYEMVCNSCGHAQDLNGGFQRGL
jgi:hypothetical protein